MPDLLVEAVGGASGNMLLGGLLELGLARDRWLSSLATLPLSPWKLVEKRVVKLGVAALHVDFEIQPCQRQWTLAHIVEALERLPSPAAVTRATRALERLARAESLSRGQEVASLSWSDGAASDLLLDVGGYFLGLLLLEIDRVYATPLPLGQGFCLHHGKPVPNPNPAVACLLTGKPQFRLPLHQETITTTGAALLAEANFELPGSFIPLMIGYGAGTSDFPISNVVRLSLLDSPPSAPQLILLETHVDDLNPQLLGLLPDRLIEEGAVDAYVTNILGKKGRPAFKVSLLCEPGRREALASYLFRHTTTLGVRSWPLERITLRRQLMSLETPLGTLQIKVRQLPDGSRAASVEYESLRELAEKHGLSLLQASARLQLTAELGAHSVEGFLEVVDEI